MADSPGSPLSEHGSDEFEEDVKLEQGSDLEDETADLPTMPPIKKQRTGQNTFRATPEPIDEDTYISSDTEGEAPSSEPLPGQLAGEDESDQQITVCRWRGCTIGDLGNMDRLVDHIHQVHIGSRQKKYACEWEGCTRIDQTHASGYALRAHMRSHTREKPFFCTLPECDKAFTRSDALAKHMRTVHETEALRPSDPVPRNHSYNTAAPKRLKLVMKDRSSERAASNGPSPAQDGVDSAANGTYPADCEFSSEEAALPPDELFALLRRQVHWAEEEGQKLKRECDALEKERKSEWRSKELLLYNLIEADLAVEVSDRQGDHTVIHNAMRIKDGMLPESMLPMHGDLPWYRQVEEMSVGGIDNAEDDKELDRSIEESTSMRPR